MKMLKSAAPAVGNTFWGFFKLMGLGVKALSQLVWSFTKSYIATVMKFTTFASDDSGALVSKWWTKHLYLSWPIRGFAMMLVPFVILIIPFGLVVTVVVSVGLIDQALWPVNDVDPVFSDQKLATAKIGVKGAVLVEASIYQLEKALNSTLGWGPNDVIGFQYLDNRVNCQLGTLYAVRQVLPVLSQQISRLSDVDQENPELVLARQEINYTPDHWMFPESEDSYFKVIQMARKYSAWARAGDPKAQVNITTKDIASILDGIIAALAEPYGRLTRNASTVPWHEVDDRVYYASCAAAVARDVLVALRSSFSGELEKGAVANAERAVAALNSAANFNPWLALEGDGDSMKPDHRSKLAGYITEASNMIQVVRNSMQF